MDIIKFGGVCSVGDPCILCILCILYFMYFVFYVVCYIIIR